MRENSSTELDADNDKTTSMLAVIGVKEAAKLLRAHEQTVCLKAKKGEIPGRKVGRGWIFSVLALQRYLEGESSPRVMQGDQSNGGKSCRSTDLQKAQTIITNSTAQKLEKYYREALAPRIRGKRKNSTTA